MVRGGGDFGARSRGGDAESIFQEHQVDDTPGDADKGQAEQAGRNDQANTARIDDAFGGSIKSQFGRAAGAHFFARVKEVTALGRHGTDHCCGP